MGGRKRGTKVESYNANQKYKKPKERENEDKRP